MFDVSMKDVVLDVIQQHLDATRVPYNARAMFKNDRSEWLR